MNLIEENEDEEVSVYIHIYKTRNSYDRYYKLFQ